MKTTAILLLSALCLAVLPKAYSQSLFDSSLTWKEAKVRAAKTNKLIFVDCYTDWCLPCKQMDKEVFSLPAVETALNRSFVSVKANMEKGWGIDLAMRFGIRSYPTCLVLNASGQLLFMLNGRMDSATFLQKLNTQLKDSSRWYKGYTSTASLPMPSFYTNAFTQKGYRVKDSLLTSYLAGQEGYLEKEANWLILKAFADVLPSRYASYVADHYTTFSRLYGNGDASAIALGFLERKLRNAIQQNDEKAFDSTITSISAIRESFGHKQYEKLAADSWIEFYGRNNRWSEYWHQVERYRARYGTVNDIFFCRQIAASCNEQDVLKRGQELLKPILATDSSFYPVYANYMLLTKLNRDDEAAPQLRRAVSLVQKEKDPAFESYLLNNTYLLKVKSKEDEHWVRFIEQDVIAKAFPEKARFLSALLYVQFYKQYGQPEQLFNYLEAKWEVLKEDQLLHPGLKQIISGLQKELVNAPHKLQQLKTWQQQLQ